MRCFGNLDGPQAAVGLPWVIIWDAMPLGPPFGIARPLITRSRWHLSYPLNFPLQKEKWGKMGENGGKWRKMGGNGGKWGLIGGGRWKNYFLHHPSTKKPANKGTNHSCRFTSAPCFAIMWLVWSRLTPPPTDLSYCCGTQWGTRTAPCHTLTHPTKLPLVSGRLDMQQYKKCGAIEGSHCSGA